jgi:hypothetical protein
MKGYTAVAGGDPADIPPQQQRYILKRGVSFVAKAKRYPVSITDTDIFEHVLAILGAIYRNAKDEDLKKYIEEELDRALKGEWDIEGVLNPRR